MSVISTYAFKMIYMFQHFHTQLLNMITNCENDKLIDNDITNKVETTSE
jgi:hypothetical protein